MDNHDELLGLEALTFPELVELLEYVGTGPENEPDDTMVGWVDFEDFVACHNWAHPVAARNLSTLLEGMCRAVQESIANPPVPRPVRATRVELVDPAGRVRAWLGFDEGGQNPTLAFDAGGNVVAEVGVNDHPDGPSPRLWLCSRDGFEVWGAVVHPDGGLETA